MSLNERDILEEIINEEILSYLNSGYPITDEYVITLRNILRNYDLKETYNYNKYMESEE